MISSSPAPRPFFVHAFLSIAVAGLVATLAGCGPSSDAKSPSTTASAKVQSAKQGFILKSDDLTIDATVSAGTGQLGRVRMDRGALQPQAAAFVAGVSVAHAV